MSMWTFLNFVNLSKNSFPLCLVEPNIDAKKLLLTRWWCKWAFHLQNPRLNANWQNWAWQEKKLKWGDYLTHINMYWQGFGLGTTKEQIQALFRMGLGCQILSICQQFHQFSHQPYLGNFPFFFWSHKE